MCPSGLAEEEAHHGPPIGNVESMVREVLDRIVGRTYQAWA